MADRIDRSSPPTDVFRAVAENAVRVSGGGSASNNLLDELCSNESLASVSIHLCYMSIMYWKLLLAEP